MGKHNRQTAAENGSEVDQVVDQVQGGGALLDGEDEDISAAGADSNGTTIPDHALVLTGNEEALKVLGKTNRFAVMYGGWLFTPSDSIEVYKQERKRTLSQKMANVTLEIGKTGVYVSGSIYARQRIGAKTAHPEFSFKGSQGQSAIMVDSEKAKSELTAFRKFMADEYNAWRKEQNIPLAATSQTQGAAIEGLVLEAPAD